MAVNPKLPPFWPSDPHVSFAQVKAQFKTCSITAHKTKYEYVFASFSPEFAPQVQDLILRVPDMMPYDALQRELIARMALPQQRRLQQLFNSTELGDQRPMKLLCRMQQLLRAGITVMDRTLLRELLLPALTCERPHGSSFLRRNSHSRRSHS